MIPLKEETDDIDPQNIEIEEKNGEYQLQKIVLYNYEQVFNTIRQSFDNLDFNILLQNLRNLRELATGQLYPENSFVTLNIAEIIIDCATIGELLIESQALNIIILFIKAKEQFYFQNFNLDSLRNLIFKLFRVKTYNANLGFKILTELLPNYPEFVNDILQNLKFEDFKVVSRSICETADDRHLQPNFLVDFLFKIIPYLDITEFKSLFAYIIHDAFEFLTPDHVFYGNYLDLLFKLTEYEWFHDIDTEFHFGEFFNRNLSYIPEDLLVSTLGVITESSVTGNDLNIEVIANLIENQEKDIRIAAMFILGKYLYRYTDFVQKLHPIFNEVDLMNKISGVSLSERTELIYILTAYAIYGDNSIKSNLIEADLINEMTILIESSNFVEVLVEGIVSLINFKKLESGINAARQLSDKYDLPEIFSDLLDSEPDDATQLRINLLMNEIYQENEPPAE